MYSLLNIANSVMRLVGLGSLGALDPVEYPQFQWINDITRAIDFILWPMLIVVGSAGTVYAVVLGVNMARADSTEKREEAKKRLINVLVGIAIVVGLILFFKLLVQDGGILEQLLRNNNTPTV